VTEGNVGGGTGMIAYEFKAGIGSASRVVEFAGTNYTLGVLVQANFGERHQLMVAGVPVGKQITEQKAYDSPDWTNPDRDTGSVIVIVATDAPLLPHQLKRIAKRVAIGAARTGGIASSGSGDIFVAFSTGQDIPAQTESLVALNMLPRGAINLVFNATVEATEEAIINALVAAETMTGVDGHKAIRLPHDRLREVLKKYNRLSD
jgi:L-aminopeptidase/D-esterase-like protein